METTTCAGCGATDVAAGAACDRCGAAPAGAAADEVASSGAAPAGPAADDLASSGVGLVEGEPQDLPPAREARRICGLAVPLVAAAAVLGIGGPLTALSVSRIGHLPASAGVASSSKATGAGPGVSLEDPSRGKARLRGAVAVDGAVTPLTCRTDRPTLVLVGPPADRYSILVSVPQPGAGTRPLEPQGAFVAVARLGGGSETWTSRDRAGASGTVTVKDGGSLSAKFSGLEPSGGGAEGTLDGTLEVNCG